MQIWDGWEETGVSSDSDRPSEGEHTSADPGSGGDAAADRRDEPNRRRGARRPGGPDETADRRGQQDRRGAGGNRRLETRLRKRIPCEIVEGDSRGRGMVLDVSPKGLFVQTLKPIDPGVEIDVVFAPPTLDRSIEVRASVVRNLRVPPHLASVASGGVGLRIILAPPEYYAFIAALTLREDKPAAAKEPEEPKPKPKKRKLPPRMPKPETMTRYRIRAKTAGNRTRSLIVSATSLGQAESQVLEELGNDWKIVSVEAV